MRPRALSIAACAALGLLALAGCSSAASGNGVDSAGGPSAQVPPRATVQIYAAASLTAAFDELAAEFEAEHPDIDVLPIAYGGSSTLATQIVEGAPADVFASADEPNMATVVDAGLGASTPTVFASNTLVVALAPRNPGGIETLADLADATVALCAPEVPCGRASRKLLDAAGVTLTPVSLEQSVTAVLQKVVLGEVDAGLVYASDVVGDAAGVSSFVPEGASAVVNFYPIIALKHASHGDAAARFVEFVLGETGARVLSEHGFGGR